MLLLGSVYVVHSIGPIHAAKHSASAFDNAQRLIGWERDLSLPNEASLQHSFLQGLHLAQAASAFYAYAHLPLTALVLVVGTSSRGVPGGTKSGVSERSSV